MSTRRNHEPASLPPPADPQRWQQELDELNAAIARLERALPALSAARPPVRPKPGAKPRRRATAAPTAAAPVAETSPIVPIPTAEPAAATPTPAPAALPPTPSGTTLDDPRNFSLMPPATGLEPGGLPAEDFRRQLAQHISFATTVLHTSGVPAAVWRAWREFEKAARERVRALAPVPTDDPDAA